MAEFRIQESRLTVSRTATIAVSGSLDIPVRAVWIVLHGYAQRAAEFLALFEPAGSDSTLFVAPEGLSRFYRRLRSGDIGASWMTSEAREDEIRDYIAYLNQVYCLILEQQGSRPAVIGLLGFSQGASTASRWIAACSTPGAGDVSGDGDLSGSGLFDRLVLWGGTPATELRNLDFQTGIAPCRTDWVTGTDDRFTPPEKLHELLPLMNAESNPIRITTFDGKHELPPDVLREILAG
jgi:dienelactone hydrolase